MLKEIVELVLLYNDYQQRPTVIHTNISKTYAGNNVMCLSSRRQYFSISNPIFEKVLHNHNCSSN